MEQVMDDNGFFGRWGGAYIPEILHETFQQLSLAYKEARQDPFV